MEPVHSARAGHVHQPPLLLQAGLAALADRAVARQDALVEPVDPHQRELQSLGLVDGHQLDFVVVLLVVGVGVEGDVLEVGLDGEVLLVLVLLFVHPYGFNQLLEVLQALFFGVGAVLGHKSALLQQALQQRCYPAPGHLPSGFRDELDESRRLVVLKPPQVFCQGGKQRASPRGGIAAQECDGLLADLPGGDVGYALERHIVVEGHQPQVAQGILDLLPFEETHSAPYYIRDFLPDEDLLDRTGQVGGTVEHGHILPRQMRFPELPGQRLRLVPFILAVVEQSAHSGAAKRYGGARKAVFVIRDDAVRHTYDVAGRTVVLF